MKIKKISLYLLLLLSVILIYFLTLNNKKYYIALGDSLTEGMTPSGKIDKSYSDSFSNYLKNNNKLKFYTKKFSKSGYRTIDLLNDIEDNVEKDGLKINNAIAKANLITITIGANDFLHKLKDNSSISKNELIIEFNEVYKDMDILFNKIRKLTTANIILIGYYNPLPKAELLSTKEMDEFFAYVDMKSKQLCDNYNIKYIDLYNDFKHNPEFLPNVFDIHPSMEGYEFISSKLINYYEKSN
ncbi:MAG: GDSL-type esterase/lipase family protein [Bacilli bacterium]